MSIDYIENSGRNKTRVITCEMIKETQAFKNADKIQQCIISMPQQRKRIIHGVFLLQNVGLERWETLSKDLPMVFKRIIKELAAI